MRHAKQKNLEQFSKQRVKFSRLKGMRDVLFDEYRYWDLVIRKSNDLAYSYGFRAVKFPILEKLDLYEKTSGKNKDKVLKELYCFTDKDGDKVALAPSAIFSLARVFVEAKMFMNAQPIKMFWLGPLFKYDQSQSSQRQAHQFNLAIFGEATPIADVQLILIAYNFFRELQINIEIQINTIGCASCRKDYLDELKDFFRSKSKKIKLCLDCKKNFGKNPLQVLACGDPICRASLEEAPPIVDSVCDDCRSHFVKVLEYLDEMGVVYNLNPFLIREDDYSNRTIFEIWSARPEEDAGKEVVLGDGGRLGGLVEYLGGSPTPICELKINIEKTISKIKENNISLKPNYERAVFLAQLGESAKRKAFSLFEDLRRAGFSIAQSLTKDNLKSQLEEANRMKVKIILILGQKEVMDNTILMRDIDSGVQEIIDCNKIADELKKKLSVADISSSQKSFNFI